MTSATRIILSAIVISAIFIGTSGTVTTVAAAEQACLEPGNSGDCSAYTQIEGALKAIFEVAYAGLQYAGLITVVVGGMMWFTASHNSERAQNGIWIFMGGILMVGFYFIFTAFISLLKWISGA